MRHAPWRAFFNIGQYGLALSAAYGVTILAGERSFDAGGRPTWMDVAVVAAAAAAWFAVKYGTVTIAVRLHSGGHWWPTFRHGVAFELVSTGSLLLLAPVLVAAAHTSAALIPLVLVPLFAVYRMARLSAEQEQLARLDPLTGLANRKALLAEVHDHTPAHAERAAAGAPDRHLALLLLDLDHFKHVNDALGHAVGDRLLVEVSDRLTAAVRPSDIVARLGGDEFAILAGRLAGPDDARELAERIVATLAEPVPLDGLPLDVAGSIGIALYPDHGEDFATLMRHADVAMYDAKHRGDAVAVYAPESDHNSPERLSLLGDLRRALESEESRATKRPNPAGEIAMYYQPQIAIETGEVVGVEALLRWRHPRRGMVDPEELIRVAEQSAVMRLLTRRVVDDVVEQLAKWAAAGVHLRAAVNVSVRDLQTSEIADQITERLSRYGVDAVPAPAGDHRGRADGRPAPGPGHDLAPGEDGRGDRARRLRHRLLVDATPAPAAADRGQGRPVVRAGDGGRRRRRRDRAIDDRAVRRARPAGGRGGRGGRAHLAAAPRGGLPRGAGLVLRPPHAGRRAGGVAGPLPPAAPRHRPRAAGLAGEGRARRAGRRQNRGMATATAYASGVSALPLLGETIGQNLARTVEAHGDREALVDVASGRRWTYRELAGEVERLARGLLAAGVDKGDRVGIWAPNCPEWIFLQYATARVGAILVNVNPAYRCTSSATPCAIRA